MKLRHVALALCLLATSCGSREQTPPTIKKQRADHAGQVRRESPLPEQFRGKESSIASSRILDKLPEDTFLLAHTGDANALATKVELEAILREYPPLQKEIESRLSYDGGDIVSPSTWARLGLRSSGEAAVALFVRERPIAVFVGEVEDRIKAIEAAKVLAPSMGLDQPIVAEKDGMTTITSLREPEVAIAISDSFAYLIIANRDEDLVTALDGITAGFPKSLAVHGEVAVAFSGFDFGADLAGYIGFKAITDRLIADERNYGSSYYAERAAKIDVRIAEARKSNAPKKEVVELEEELRDLIRQDKRQQLRRRSSRQLLEKVIGPLGPVAMGVVFEGKTTRARARFTMASTSLPRKLFTGKAGSFLANKSTFGLPLFSIGLRPDPMAALELLELVAGSEGESRRQLQSMFEKQFGVPALELLALYDGEGSVTFSMDPASVETGDIRVGYEAIIGLKNGADVQGLFRKLVVSETGWLRGDGYVIRTISPIEQEQVSEIDGRLRYRRGHPNLLTPNDQVDQSALLAMEEQRGFLLLDPVMAGFATFVSYSEVGLAMPVPDENRPKVEALRKELEDLERQLRKERTKAAIKGAQAFGTLRAVGRPHRGRIAIVGEIVGESANMGRAIQRMFESLEPEFQDVRSNTPSPLTKLKAEVDQKRQRLYDIRREAHSQSIRATP